MIPKIIHYCWFGKSPISDDVKKYIKTWKDKMPDYELKLWNEENFDVSQSNVFVQEAYKMKKWAFVSDYVRLYALYNFGGIYLDTDVEVFKPFDNLLDNDVLFGFESKDYISTAVIMSKPHNGFIKKLMEIYRDRRFINDDGKFNMETNVHIITDSLKKEGLRRNGRQQVIGNIKIVPQYYFSSNNILNIFNIYSKKSYAYHHYLASWYSNKSTKGIKNRIRHFLLVLLRNIIGTDTINALKKARRKDKK